MNDQFVDCRKWDAKGALELALAARLHNGKATVNIGRVNWACDEIETRQKKKEENTKRNKRHEQAKEKKPGDCLYRDSTTQSERATNSRRSWTTNDDDEEKWQTKEGKNHIEFILLFIPVEVVAAAMTVDVAVAVRQTSSCSFEIFLENTSNEEFEHDENCEELKNCLHRLKILSWQTIWSKYFPYVVASFNLLWQQIFSISFAILGARSVVHRSLSLAVAKHKHTLAHNETYKKHIDKCRHGKRKQTRKKNRNVENSLKKAATPIPPKKQKA